MSEAGQDGQGAAIATSSTVPAAEMPASAAPVRRLRRRWPLAAAAAVVVAAAGVAAALLVASSSAPPATRTSLIGALAKTAGESYRFTVDSTANLAGKEMNADVVAGAVDPARELGTETLTETLAQGQPQTAQIRFIGDDVYTWVSAGPGRTDLGKPWNRAPIQPSGTVTLPASDPYAFVSDEPVSPDEILALVRSATTVRAAGAASGPGWTGTKYTFSGRLGAQSSVTGTAYVDAQGQVRRLATTTTLGAGSTTVRDLTFTGFGASVQVTAPPAAQVKYTDRAYWGFYF
jgi:hypothetical protein